MSRHIVGQGERIDPHSLGLDTRKKRHIINERRPEWSPSRLKLAKDEVRNSESYSGVIFRSISSVYNCMGMVFAARRTWVDNDELTKILSDDDYSFVSDQADIKMGDIAVYRDSADDVTHVGIVLERKIVEGGTDPGIVVLSKWGPKGEYVHPINVVPVIYGHPSEFWTDRRIGL